MKLVAIAAAALTSASALPALAEQQAASNAFGLGQIIVTAPQFEDVPISTTTLSSEAIYTFNRNSLDEAASLIPGVSASSTGGQRNEKLIFVRGFDRFQVPLSIDGIRVYLPADNRLDYGRFLTPDIAEIQVAKGYASVLDGPGAMGGAINLVTRKPTREFEAEARATLGLDSDFDYAGYNVFASLGTRQEKWYAQGSFTRNFTDHWDLAGGYEPTPGSAEDGGARDFSRTRDWRMNLKAGFTPNDTDEYSISYTRQEGGKNAPLHVTDPVGPQRYWSWPFWNIESIYFLSSTQLADWASLKTRLYRNTFDNLLRSFDSRAQNSQTLMRSFNSWYQDEAVGGSAQLDLALSSIDTLSIAFHYRRDKHVEFQQVFPSGFTEPPQVNLEETYSIAAENRLELTDTLSFIAGFSYDWRDLKRAEEWGTPPGVSGGPSALFSYPIEDADAFNDQGKLVWQSDDLTSVHASVSSRSRFPTVFERFSSRFGGAVSNPDLNAERATNVEIGAGRAFGVVRAEGALFYSRLSDVIVAFPFIYRTCTPQGVCTDNPVSQSRNLGKGDYYGGEISLTADLGPSLRLGANYTYTHRSLDDPSNAAFRPTGVPAHKAFLYADWSPLEGLHIVPNMDIASSRWTVNTGGTRYYRTGSYALVNLRIDYELVNGVELGIGGRNLFDGNYTLADGFPEQGRSFFLSVRARY
ncbi:MAG: TonB-dependent receptor plug domain-containing protein [Sphingomonadales bacterium]